MTVVSRDGHDISGTTANRFSNGEPGQTYFDTTLNTLCAVTNDGTIKTISGHTGIVAVTAAGTNQATAANLTNGSTNNVTGADGTKGVILQTPTAVGAVVRVYNSSASALPVYPQTGATINNGSANASLSIPANSEGVFTYEAAGAWSALAAGTTATASSSASLTGTASPFPIAGLAGAQGGAVTVTGGASSTSGNAGGSSSLAGGAAGATGVGGAVLMTGAAGGATSGVGGAATIAAGAGTAGNSAGGVASQTGGAGQGSAAGGVSKIVGGAGGATGAGGAAQVTGGAGGATSGTGGAVAITGGAGTNGNATGGAVTISGGALNGSGANGSVTIQSAYAPVAGGGTSAAILCTSTALTGVYWGTGAPTFSAGKGSLYVRTDASTSATRLYVSSDAVGTWTAFTSAA